MLDFTSNSPSRPGGRHQAPSFVTHLHSSRYSSITCVVSRVVYRSPELASVTFPYAFEAKSLPSATSPLRWPMRLLTDAAGIRGSILPAPVGIAR